jgi:hypothetical protein
MIQLNDDNDPLLFCVTIPSGQIVLQYMEVLAYAQARMSEAGQDAAQAGLHDIVAAIRAASRTKDVAAAASDHELKAVWLRVTKAVESAGNG